MNSTAHNHQDAYDMHSCCGGAHMEHDHSHKGGVFLSSETYYCPMRCEGNKTYDRPGNCPVCNMKLVRTD